ncbi:MAG TPA: response regulator [Pyrinomonadaceae bacterium]|nr:response regulator [Pyrinomonadaceae bacterium]
MDLREARKLLAEGHAAAVEKSARSRVRALEKAGEAAPLAEALVAQASALARLGRQAQAEIIFRRALEVAEEAGERRAEGEAALAAVEELGDRLGFRRASALYMRASELLARSPCAETLRRLNSCAQKILGTAAGETPEELDVAPPDPEAEGWEHFSLREAMRNYEAQIIERALKEAGGVVTRAAHLLGFKHHNSLIALLNTRHRDLLSARSPVVPRRAAATRRRRGRVAASKAGKRAARAESPDEVTILYVEDDIFVADAVRVVLSEEGWRVVVCSDGFTGLKMIESNVRYDLLLLDHDLPGMTGLELVRQARRLEHRRETPVVMLSAGGHAGEARRAGVNAFLRKPEDISALPETVTRLLGLDAG